MKGLSRAERLVMMALDDEAPIEPYSPTEAADAEGLIRRGLIVRVEPWAPAGLGDDVTPLGRRVLAWVSPSSLVTQPKGEKR